ncbi:MAG: ribosome silencing factor [Thermotogae bacterium]|nr:ribosome silencing factor [Thermotogota bacterium]
MLSENLQRILNLIREAAGEDVVILDIRKINPAIAEYFVIATGYTSDHLLDMAERLVSAFGGRVEGGELSSWVLVDMGDVVAHLFLPDARAFYSLEELYGDADVVFSEKEEMV